ncbi:MAG TPA: DUF3108 domain-containing protein [Geobacteraceae bacterium]|nr:DUF3108 domain-containing protein [Geobacteraceae bacterium]
MNHLTKIANTFQQCIRRMWLALMLLLVTWLIWAMPAAAAPTLLEKLYYDITWTGIKGGTVEQEIIDEGDAVRVVSTARTSDWVSVFFKVEDRVETLLAKAEPPHVGLPRYFRMKIREGSHRRDKEIFFDQKGLKAEYIDHINNLKLTLPIWQNTYDFYSGFFYMRSLKLDVGKSVYVNIFDSMQMWNVEIQVVKKEKLKTILGEVNTICVRPIVKSEGIFQRKGAIDIWMTDDERRIPVRMRTKVTLGSVTATLVKMN